MTVIYATKGIEHDERNPPLQKSPRTRHGARQIGISKTFDN